MSRLIDAVSPPRMGRSFRLLLASSWTSNLGDGIALSAGPLLIASQTRDPVLVALASVLQRLPWLIFGVGAGVTADRFSRKLVIAVANAARIGVLIVVAVTIVTGSVNVVVVLVALFLLGVAETFADNTTETFLPMVVERDDLGIGNARIMVGHITINQLAGPPIGAALFATGWSLPFVSQAVLLAFATALIWRISLDGRDVVPADPAQRTSFRTELIEGVRFLWASRAVRALALTILAFNVTFGAAWSILVLYSLERLGLGTIGFGVLTAVSAAGGVLGTMLYGPFERRVSLAAIMKGGLVIETLTHLGLALTDQPVIAMAILFVFGAHASIWGTTARSIRQRAVPNEFQGRVAGVYLTGMHGGLVVGGVIGGIVAGIGGVTAPFWFAFVGSAVILAAFWRELDHIAHTV